MTKQITKTIKKELYKYASTERKKTNEWFFKTGKGQYGEGDIFIGVRVPNIRKVANEFKDVAVNDLQELAESPVHEERLLAILILVYKSKIAHKNIDKVEQKRVLKFYIKNRKFVNNWDLVDLSAHYILGQAIIDGVESVDILHKYAKSKILWERRIAMVATWIFIRDGVFVHTLDLAEVLLADNEDLMHKAVGWMLREVWKRDSEIVEEFLCKHYNELPRATLRYAIERMEEGKRKDFLSGGICGMY